MIFTGERMIPEHNHGSQLYTDHIDRYRLACQYVKGKTVLDVACGSGYGSKMLAVAGAKDVLGVDNSKEAVSYAWQHFSHPRLTFGLGDVQRLSRLFVDVWFDVIVSFETIEHLTDTKGFLDGIERSLKTGSLFFVSTPNTDVYKSQSQFHPRMFSEGELCELLAVRFKHLRLYGQHNRRYIVVIASQALISAPCRLPATLQHL